ncbi:MAG: DUF2085 domain-containing protein [Candidatus Dojkabacteria bacterium]|nr:MAG: DUF2085 domain-containing protein [Candidatus Dojkabacteria bacterium]
MRRLPEILLIFVSIYVLLAFAAPTLLRLGFTDAGMGIHSIYRIFCHQRVERSAFLFGEEGIINFYTRDELQEAGVIPLENPEIPEPFDERFFGYPYVGNSEMGYKMPLCMRDVPLYLAFLIFGWIYLAIARKKKRVKKFPWWMILLFMMPMAVDGVFQYATEFFLVGQLPEAYYDNIPKRIVTGALFGIGFAMIIIPVLLDSLEMLYNNGEDSKLEKNGSGNEKS